MSKRNAGWVGWILGLGMAWTPLHAATAQETTASGQAVLQRLLGSRAGEIHLRLVTAGQPQHDWYAVHGAHGRIDVQGSSVVALVHGTYAYLQTEGLASVSQEDRRVDLPAQLPDYRSGTITTPFEHRVFLNPCTYGYTTPFWDWPRWEREIDWMALHGIDMPLALEGQEFVWQRTWRELGLGDAQLADYFSGPAFAPWQRMGNIQGHFTPLPQHWIDDKAALQKRILARMRALGMHPVLPAFAGYVPKTFALAHPEARIYRMRAWEGFHETYWLDPSDPLFAQIASRFLAIYDATYGKGQYYLADAFNEMLPPMSDDAHQNIGAYGDNAQAKGTPAQAVPAEVRDRRLAAYGKAIYRSIQQAAPGATWVMQSWLFGADQRFWTPGAIAAFLRDVPDRHLLVLDIGNDRYPDVWKQAKAFEGKRWVYGYVFNYGGSNPVYGDLGYYRDDLSNLLKRSDTGQLAGFGVFPEGVDSSAVIYEYLYALAWEGPRQTLPEWTESHLRARYGHVSPALLQAWDSLRPAVFSTRYWSTRWWQGTAGAYLFSRRPSSKITGFPGSPGDIPALHAALLKLLSVAPQYADSPLFRSDLVDFARHYASLRIDQKLQQAIAAYQRKDVAAGDDAMAQIRTIAMLADQLMGGQPDTLASWTREAADYAHTLADRQTYLANARTLITIWGGDGNLPDYASRAWQGMYSSFYLPRWNMFLSAMREAAVGSTAFDEAATRQRIAAWEKEWTQRGVYIAPASTPITLPRIQALVELAAHP